MITAVHHPPHPTPPTHKLYFHRMQYQINLSCCLYNNISIKDNNKNNINNNTTTTITTTMTTMTTQNQMRLIMTHVILTPIQLLRGGIEGLIMTKLMRTETLLTGRVVILLATLNQRTIVRCMNEINMPLIPPLLLFTPKCHNFTEFDIGLWPIDPSHWLMPIPIRIVSSQEISASMLITFNFWI